MGALNQAVLQGPSMRLLIAIIACLALSPLLVFAVRRTMPPSATFRKICLFAFGFGLMMAVAAVVDELLSTGAPPQKWMAPFVVHLGTGGFQIGVVLGAIVGAIIFMQDVAVTGDRAGSSPGHQPESEKSGQ